MKGRQPLKGAMIMVNFYQQEETATSRVMNYEAQECLAMEKAMMSIEDWPVWKNKNLITCRKFQS